ncbi:hypothetical protein HCX49_10260 [Sphingobacterium kitahiroshimense]|jgi:hypothetical protein|uniref:hypothetical protein n=1 Tax=Sphingobacterium sp. B16(2022) TaxID=2914044 RepID=UPI001438E3F2|nr:hypothetical protein [Sphingobacterium sp. B16(2022)]NJI73588.1 hypothetical protein [Sphingobacterium sp. B16(2022)]
MKKKIAIALYLITILICGWIIINYVKYVDISSNKTDWYVMDAKHKVSERTDINNYEKELLKNQIDQNRKNEKNIAKHRFSNSISCFCFDCHTTSLVSFYFPNPK